ncbi:MAG: hypothetical protein P1P84_22100 [Deferrisomatales bacterium]|nr:hypothetical protein [Deferrisomatales bacterium]
MSNANRKIAAHKNVKLPLLYLMNGEREASPPQPGSLSMGPVVREALTAVLRKCPLSRYEVAGKMSEFIGGEVTKTMLDAYTADSKETHRFPFELAPAFIAATTDRSILSVVATPVGCKVVAGQDVLMLELAKIGDEKSRLCRQERDLRALIHRMTD